MGSYNITDTSNALKKVFDRDTVKDLTYRDNPLLGMVGKKQTGEGGYEYPLRYTVSGGRSRTIATALAAKKAAKIAKFSVTLVADYNAISIDRRFMMGTKKDEYAFLDARVDEVKQVLKHLSRSLAVGMYRGTGGACGQVAASGGISGSTITLQDTEEICNFEVGDVLVMSSANGDAVADALEAGSLTISNINRDTGVITFSAAVTTGIPTAAVSYYLFKDGDFQASLAGLAAWNPTTAPGSTAFFGQDRSVDVTRLAGCIVSATGDPIEEAIAKGCARLGREGRNPDTVVMSHRRMRDLLLALGSKVEYATKDSPDAKVGFEGVSFVSPRGKVKCFADQNCPDAVLRIFKLDALELLYSGSDVPELQEEDGNILHREPAADAFEVRGSYYANLRVKDPSELCVVSL